MNWSEAFSSSVRFVSELTCQIWGKYSAAIRHSLSVRFVSELSW